MSMHLHCHGHAWVAGARPCSCIRFHCGLPLLRQKLLLMVSSIFSGMILLLTGVKYMYKTFYLPIWITLYYVNNNVIISSISIYFHIIFHVVACLKSMDLYQGLFLNSAPLCKVNKFGNPFSLSTRSMHGCRHVLLQKIYR